MKCLFGHDWLKKREPQYWAANYYEIEVANLSPATVKLLENAFADRFVYTGYTSVKYRVSKSAFDGICKKCHKIHMGYQETIEEVDKLIAQAKAISDRNDRLVSKLDAHIKMRDYTK